MKLKQTLKCIKNQNYKNDKKEIIMISRNIPKMIFRSIIGSPQLQSVQNGMKSQTKISFNFKKVNSKMHTYLFSTMKNPYQTLNVSKNATIDEIKKAYRTLAQKYHPDKNPDPKAQIMFVQVKQAYQILSDQDKKRQFDNETTGSNYGSTGRSQGFDKNPFDQFNDNIFKDKTRSYHETYTQGSTKRRKGDDILRTIQLNFVDAVKGIDINIEYEKKATCLSCHGNKCKPGTAPTRCLACGGSGTTVYRQNSIVMHLECVRCKGVGLVIKHPCTDCKATGILVQNVKQIIKIPPGVQDNGTMSLRQKGNQSQNGPSGDLHIKFVVRKHPKFRKKGDNIVSTQWVTISQAALGAKKKIDTIWGTRQLQVPSGVQDGAQLTLPKQGIETTFGKGDHIAITRIIIPKTLTQNQRRIFMQLAKNEEQVWDRFEAQNKQSDFEQSKEDQKDQSSSYMHKFKKIFK